MSCGKLRFTCWNRPVGFPYFSPYTCPSPCSLSWLRVPDHQSRNPGVIPRLFFCFSFLPYPQPRLVPCKVLWMSSQYFSSPSSPLLLCVTSGSDSSLFSGQFQQRLTIFYLAFPPPGLLCCSLGCLSKPQTLFSQRMSQNLSLSTLVHMAHRSLQSQPLPGSLAHFQPLSPAHLPSLPHQAICPSLEEPRSLIARHTCE